MFKFGRKPPSRAIGLLLLERVPNTTFAALRVDHRKEGVPRVNVLSVAGVKFLFVFTTFADKGVVNKRSPEAEEIVFAL